MNFLKTLRLILFCDCVSMPFREKIRRTFKAICDNNGHAQENQYSKWLKHVYVTI